MKVLIVDDELELVKFLRDFICEKGHKVDTAYDGGRAIALIKAHPYDVIFADHNMPELTGLEIAKYVRQENLETKTIIITGYPILDDFFAKSVGADEFVTKPFSLDTISDLLDKYSRNVA